MTGYTANLHTSLMAVLTQLETRMGFELQINSGNVTTTVANELLVGCASSTGATSDATATSGFTIRQSPSFRVVAETQVVSSTGTYSSQVVWNASGNDANLIMTFKEPAGSSDPTFGFLRRGAQ
jgi:hypothetical protein